MIVHATACAAERNCSAWKLLCKAERVAMTLEHFKERMIIAEYYNQACAIRSGYGGDPFDLSTPGSLFSGRVRLNPNDWSSQRAP